MKQIMLGLLALALAVGSLAGEAAAQAARKMYWTDQGPPKIRRANLDGSGVQDLVTGLGGQPFGIALDVTNSKMYWVDPFAQKIQRANLDGSGVQDLVTGLQAVAIAVDGVGGRMYWANFYAAKIQRANLDGSGIQDLVMSQAPRAIALDVPGGKMYWTDISSQKIQRANLDGSGVQDLVSGAPAYSIALDVVGGKMYWTAWAIGNPGKIQRANLDGSSIQDLVTGGVNSSGIALDVAAEKMYWTNDDFPSETIRRANLDGSETETLLTGLGFPTGIALDLTIGGVAKGLLPAKVVCRNITTGKKVKATLTPGTQFWDCAAAGLVVNAGDVLKMVLPGSALNTTVGGLGHGFQPTKIVCKDIITGQRVKITRGPGFLSWDCTEAGLVVQPADRLRMTVSGSE